MVANKTTSAVLLNKWCKIKYTVDKSIIIDIGTIFSVGTTKYIWWYISMHCVYNLYESW